MTTADLEPDRRRKVLVLESYTYKTVPTDVWLGNAFYRENIGATGEPDGFLPKD